MLSPEVLKEHGLNPAVSTKEQLRQGGQIFSRLLRGYDGAYEKAAITFRKGTGFGDSFAQAQLAPADQQEVGDIIQSAMAAERANLGLNHSPFSHEKTVRKSELQSSRTVAQGMGDLINLRYADGLGTYAAEWLMPGPDRKSYTLEQLAERINYHEARRRGLMVDEDFLKMAPAAWMISLIATKPTASTINTARGPNSFPTTGRKHWPTWAFSSPRTP